MTMLTVTQAAARVKRSPNSVLRYCRSGHVRAIRGRHPQRNQTVWLVDIADLIDHIAGRRSRPDPDAWNPAVSAAADGDLTEVQHQCIARERWHELLDIQPDDAAPGAVRATWSDGETFAILPDGDTTGYRYLKPHILEELCLE